MDFGTSLRAINIASEGPAWRTVIIVTRGVFCRREKKSDSNTPRSIFLPKQNTKNASRRALFQQSDTLVQSKFEFLYRFFKY